MRAAVKEALENLGKTQEVVDEAERLVASIGRRIRRLKREIERESTLASKANDKGNVRNSG